MDGNLDLSAFQLVLIAISFTPKRPRWRCQPRGRDRPLLRRPFRSSNIDTMTRALLLPVLLATAAAAQDGLAVVRANCLPCHSEKNPTSGLSLETRESSFRGGNRGPAIAADNPESSTLLKAIR